VEKLDLRARYKSLYNPPSRGPVLVEVPDLLFLMVDGAVEAGVGPSDSAGFQDAMGALYTMGYTLKFMAKKRPVEPVDYPVMAVEGLWWVESGDFSFDRVEPWHYRLMMMVPDLVTPAMVGEALAEARRKQPGLDHLRLERFEEGLSAQIMHIGPYSDEPATIEKLHAFVAEQGYRLRGHHHEIYLGDPRRAAPEKLRTVLRHPVEPA
jgi:hypothetical protein